MNNEQRIYVITKHTSNKYGERVDLYEAWRSEIDAERRLEELEEIVTEDDDVLFEVDEVILKGY